MSLDQEVAILKKIPLFENVEASRLKLMAFASERMRFESGEAICRQGEQGDAAFIIIDGEAEVSIATDDGPLVVARVGANDIIGEIAILINIPRTATVTACGEMTTLKVTKELFFQLVNDFPEIGIEVMRVLAHRLESTNQKLRAANE